MRPHLVTDAIKRRWYLIVILAVLLPLAVGAYVLRVNPSYTAAAKVLVRPIPGNALSTEATGSNSQVTVAMETEASLVSSPDVTELANKGLDDDIEAGSTQVAASVPPNTEIVQIEFTASTAKGARDGAQAFAKAFLAYRAQQAEATLKYQSDTLATQAKNAENSLKRAASTAASDEPPPDAASQVQLYASRLATLQDSIGQLQTLDTQPGSLITPAKTPDAPAGPNALLLIVAAALAGLAGGLALAVWRERSDDRVRASSETSVLGVPVLASVPADHRRGPHLITEPGTDDRLHDAYRRARTGVLANAQLPSVVVVSAVAGGVPVAHVAANLAVSLGNAGHRVVLVDASTRDTDTLHDVGIDADAGLSDVVMGLPLSEIELSEIELSGAQNVRVLTAGTQQEAASERYAGSALTDVLARLRADADFVVVAAPPASAADSGSVALAGDLLVLALEDHHTTHEEVADALDRAERLGVTVLGVLIAHRTRRVFRTPRKPAVVATADGADQLTEEAVQPADEAAASSAHQAADDHDLDDHDLDEQRPTTTAATTARRSTVTKSARARSTVTKAKSVRGKSAAPKSATMRTATVKSATVKSASAPRR